MPFSSRAAESRILGKEEHCADDEFQCLQLNLNQILSINDWNRRPRECIPQAYRLETMRTVLSFLS